MQQKTESLEQAPEEVAALALARGQSQTEAATEAGVHRSTICRWLRTEDFRERVAESRRDILSRATSKLGDRILSAIDTLSKLLESENEAVKLGAARCLLQSLLPLSQQTELEERIAQIEGRT